MAESEWEECQRFPPVNVYTERDSVLSGIEPSNPFSMKQRNSFIDLTEANPASNTFETGVSDTKNDCCVGVLDFQHGCTRLDDKTSIDNQLINVHKFYDNGEIQLGRLTIDENIINLNHRENSQDIKRDLINSDVCTHTVARTVIGCNNSYCDSTKSDILSNSNGVMSSHTNQLLSQNSTSDRPHTLVEIGNISDNQYRLHIKTPDMKNISLNDVSNSDRRNGHSSLICDSETDCEISPISEETHCHNSRKMKKDIIARNQLIAVVVLCLTFMAGEAIGGVLSNSLALFTDVLHLGSDLISFLISLLAIYLSRKSPTRKMSFGYHRAEVLGALISVFLIWLVSGVLCYIAIERIIKEHYKDVKADEMLITASLGVVFNLVMAGVLHSEVCCCSSSSHSKFGHNHSHSHSHSHGSSKSSKHSDYQQLPLIGERINEEIEVDEDIPRQKNINVRAAFIHVIGDIIQSIGVFVAALIIKFTEDEKYRLADPICTFIFSLLVLITTVSVLRDTLRVMLEATPRDISYDYVKQRLETLDGVEMVHSLHIWSLTLGRNAMTAHLAKNDNYDHQHILQEANKLLKSEFSFYHVTIQVEKYNHEIMTKCNECLELQ